MADKLRWFPFYAGDWMTDQDVLELTGEQMGAYLWLLCLQWQQGALPYEAHRVVAMSPRGIPEVAITYVLLKFFPPDPDTNERRNPKLAGIRERQLATYEVRVGLAAKARKSKQDNKVSSDQPSHHVGDEDEVLYIYNLSFGEQQLPQEVVCAAAWYLRPERTRMARFGVLRGILQGITAPALPVEAVVRGMKDLATSSQEPRPVVVRTWCERAVKIIAGEAGAKAAQETPSAVRSVLGQPDANGNGSGGFAEDELE